MKETTTQVLKRIEAKIDGDRCFTTKKEYDDHCSFIDEAKIIIPQFSKAIKEFTVALEDGRRSFTEVTTRLTVIETQKKMTVWLIALISGICSSILSGIIILIASVLFKKFQ